MRKIGHETFFGDHLRRTPYLQAEIAELITRAMKGREVSLNHEPTSGLEPLTCRLRIRFMDLALACTKLHRTVISEGSTFLMLNHAARKSRELRGQRGKFGVSRIGT
jgi:hypothetical protein